MPHPGRHRHIQLVGLPVKPRHAVPSPVSAIHVLRTPQVSGTIVLTSYTPLSSFVEPINIGLRGLLLGRYG